MVHDLGGQVGFDLAMGTRARIRSLTILNTMIELPRMPFPGEVWGRLTHGGVGGPGSSPRLWRQLMVRVGVEDRSALPMSAILAYRDLALASNDGATYLAIMRHLRDVHDAGRWGAVVDSRTTPYPVSIVWGGLDPSVSLRRFGWRMLAAAHLPWMTVLPARHFLQEDQAPQVAELIAQNARHESSSAIAVDRRRGSTR